MRRLVGLVGCAALCLAFAAQASAATTSVSMSFTEQIVANAKQGCSVFPEGLCGNGVVLPFGHVTETILFGAGCGGSCELRTIYLPGGSITSTEQFAPGRCPGVCQPNPAEPGQGILSDTIVGGTGAFAAAAGGFTGTVFAAGPSRHGSFHGHDHAALTEPQTGLAADLWRAHFSEV